VYIRCCGKSPGKNSKGKAPVVTNFSPDFTAPTQSPAANRYSMPLAAGHCREGASLQGKGGRSGVEPKRPKLLTRNRMLPQLCTFLPVFSRIGCRPGKRSGCWKGGVASIQLQAGPTSIDGAKSAKSATTARPGARDLRWQRKLRLWERK